MVAPEDLTSNLLYQTNVLLTILYSTKFPINRICILVCNIYIIITIVLPCEKQVDIKKLQKQYPETNIIFCTGYSEYSLDALELYCSAYLMKPITEEKLKEALRRLRYPISEKVSKLYVQCFGNFEVLYENQSIKFRYGKTKELFAYLIDRGGAALSIKEIMAAICEKDDKESYMRNRKTDLINTFQLLGIDQVLMQERGNIGVKKEKIDCDYYDYLAGERDKFRGEYMSQFSFAEATLAQMK